MTDTIKEKEKSTSEVPLISPDQIPFPVHCDCLSKSIEVPEIIQNMDFHDPMELFQPLGNKLHAHMLELHNDMAGYYLDDEVERQKQEITDLMSEYDSITALVSHRMNIFRQHLEHPNLTSNDLQQQLHLRDETIKELTLRIQELQLETETITILNTKLKDLEMELMRTKSCTSTPNHENYISSQQEGSSLTLDSHPSNVIPSSSELSNPSPHKVYRVLIECSTPNITYNELLKDLNSLLIDYTSLNPIKSVIKYNSNSLLISLHTQNDLLCLEKYLQDNISRSSYNLSYNLPTSPSKRFLIKNLPTTTDTNLIESHIRQIIPFPIQQLHFHNNINTYSGNVHQLWSMDVESFSFLLNMKNICINLRNYKIVPYIRIMRCYNCQFFGHHARDCSREKVCNSCSDKGHDSKDCPNESYCINCAIRGFECYHSPTSRSCCTYRTLWRSYEERIYSLQKSIMH